MIQPFAVFHFFILSCLLIQFYYGYRYALVGMILSVLLGEFFFVEPIGTFDELLVKDIIISLNFIGVTLTAIALMEVLQRHAYARELLLKVSNSRYAISLQRENDRLYYAQKSNEAWGILETLIKDFDQVILMQYGAETVRLEPLFYQLTRLSPDKVHSLEWLSYVHPEDRSKLVQILESHPSSKRLPTECALRWGHEGIYDLKDSPVRIMRFVFMGQPLLLLTLR